MSAKLSAIFLLGLLFGIVETCCQVPNRRASVRCDRPTDWISAYNDRLVNYQSIFCGKRRGDRLIGFHARPGGENPPTVTQLSIAQSADERGIYAAERSHLGQPNARAISIVFPDRCSPSQVLNSIAYAETHRVACPPDAPEGAWCGPNRPDDATDRRFCRADNYQGFTIVGATDRRDRIQVGFPLR